MISKVQKFVLATALVGGLAAYANGCAIIGSVDFGLTFRPPQSVRAVDCRTALVNSVRFQFFDMALDGLLRTEVTRPCEVSATGQGTRFKVSIDLGPYNIRTQGLNGQLVICYESNNLVTIQGGKSDAFDFVVEAHPTGAMGGCQYPTIM